MLKEISLIIVIIASVIGFNFFIQNYLDKSSDEFVSELGNISRKLLEEEANVDYEGVKKEVNELENKWYGVESVWMLIILHSELDKVDSGFKELEATLETENSELSYVNAKKLEFVIESITKKDLFELKNIF